MALTFVFALLVAFAALFTQTRASPPISLPLLTRQDGITPVSRYDIESFKPYTWYAAAAHCNAIVTVSWSCGVACDANPTFKPIDVGGDGIFTQFWYVGYDPKLHLIIVGHQGTDFSKIIPGLLDLDVPLVPPNEVLFPGIPPDVLVHRGFSGTHSRSAPAVLAAVKKGLSMYPTKEVTVVGHSLGAAISLLDSVFLPLHLDSDVKVRYIGYASPRVGNQAFADYVDAQPRSFTRINNKYDPVPVVPFMEFFEYRHPSGEIHIRDDDVWVKCPGQDNPSDQCSTGSVFLGTANATQHPGPFDGVMVVCDQAAPLEGDRDLQRGSGDSFLGAQGQTALNMLADTDV